MATTRKVSWPELRMAPNRRPRTVTRRGGKTLVAFEPDEQGPMLITVAPDGREETSIDFVGPFCRNCGNPLSIHEPDMACVERRHPVFPLGDYTLPYYAYAENGRAVPFSTPVDMTRPVQIERVVSQLELATSHTMVKITHRIGGDLIWAK